MPDRRYSLKKPCAECPFSRASRPGATGGAAATTYVGQAHGPFRLPCHMAAGYEDNRRDEGLPQCAGAAMYRDLAGRAPLMPPEIHQLKGDPALVFSSPAELVAHHTQVPLWRAQALLRGLPPSHWLAVEALKLSRGAEGETREGS